MFESLTAGVHLLLAALGLIATSELASIGALGMTVAVVSAAVLLLSLLTLLLPSADRTSPAHPARAIDVSSPTVVLHPSCALVVALTLVLAFPMEHAFAQSLRGSHASVARPFVYRLAPLDDNGRPARLRQYPGGH